MVIFKTYLNRRKESEPSRSLGVRTFKVEGASTKSEQGSQGRDLTGYGRILDFFSKQDESHWGFLSSVVTSYDFCFKSLVCVENRKIWSGKIRARRMEEERPIQSLLQYSDIIFSIFMLEHRDPERFRSCSVLQIQSVLLIPAIILYCLTLINEF